MWTPWRTSCGKSCLSRIETKSNTYFATHYQMLWERGECQSPQGWRGRRWIRSLGRGEEWPQLRSVEIRSWWTSVCGTGRRKKNTSELCEMSVRIPSNSRGIGDGSGIESNPFWGWRRWGLNKLLTGPSGPSRKEAPKSEHNGSLVLPHDLQWETQRLELESEGKREQGCWEGNNGFGEKNHPRQILCRPDS